MKKELKHTLFEKKRLEDDLWEVFTTWYWNNNTYTVTDISHHSSEREAEEQRKANHWKNTNS